MKKEFRFLTGTELRAKDGNGIEGYAAVFDKPYDSGWFIETIKAGAFARALREKQDVRALMNHDANMLLGRTSNGTLTLKEDSKGLRFDCNLPDTQAARDLHALIKRGDIDGCSFGFRVQAQNWREEKDKDGKMQQYRELTDVDVFDVGPVTFPAYPQTSVDARSLWPDGTPEEIGEHVPELREKTKKVSGEDVPMSKFAYVGDPEDLSTWKLPIHDKSHAQNALARFNQTKGIPDSERPKVLAKIKAAAKKFGIHVSDENSIKWGYKGGELRDLTMGDIAQGCQCDCPECEEGDHAECSNEKCDDPNCEHAEMNSRPVTEEERARLLAWIVEVL